MLDVVRGVGSGGFFIVRGVHDAPPGLQRQESGLFLRISFLVCGAANPCRSRLKKAAAGLIAATDTGP
jgi:hypothetical protein